MSPRHYTSVYYLDDLYTMDADEKYIGSNLPGNYLQEICLDSNADEKEVKPSRSSWIRKLTADTLELVNWRSQSFTMRYIAKPLNSDTSAGTNTVSKKQSITLPINTYMENSYSGERHVPANVTGDLVREEEHSLYNVAETVFNVEKAGNYALACTSSEVDFSKLYMFIKPTFDVSKKYPYNGNDHIYGACSVVLKLDGEKVAVTSASPQYMEWDVANNS